MTLRLIRILLLLAAALVVSRVLRGYRDDDMEDARPPPRGP